MRKPIAAAVCFALGMLFVVQAFAQETSPSRENVTKPAKNAASAEVVPAATVKIVLLKSWGAASIWQDMGSNWQNFGKIPVTVDYTTYVDSDFTYQDIVASKANVIVLSDPAGGIKQYSAAEIAAVSKYAKKGHTVIGTYAVFEWSTVDNRGLAPVFGFSSKIAYNTTPVGISNLFKKTTKKSECLIKGITGSSWQSDGYPYTQLPATGSWKGHLGKATAVADSDNYLESSAFITRPRTQGYSSLIFPNTTGAPTTSNCSITLRRAM